MWSISVSSMINTNLRRRLPPHYYNHYSPTAWSHRPPPSLITCSCKRSHGRGIGSKSAPPPQWMEYQGVKDWEGLIDPLDDNLRTQILGYGHFVEAAYHCFDFDTSSPTYATCPYPKRLLLSNMRGPRRPRYKVTRNLHATCGGVRIPHWVPAAPMSSWIGYVAVCDDAEEIARVGHRNVVIAFRGTATLPEWLENLRHMLTPLPDDMAPHDQRHSQQPMVQRGLLSMYTSSGGRQSLRDTIREEMRHIVKKYGGSGAISVTITGHSLGAALATLAAYDIRTAAEVGEAPPPLVTVVSFGGPRVGNKEFGWRLEASGTKILRIVNRDDPITKVPGFVVDDDVAAARTTVAAWLRKCVHFTGYAYAEVGKELRLSSGSSSNPQFHFLASNAINIATCHDLKTYLHLISTS